jgi:hypothetical protein
MKKILKKLEKLNKVSGDTNMIQIFSDGSGFVLYETEDIRFEFLSIKQLKKYLKTI